VEAGHAPTNSAASPTDAGTAADPVRAAGTSRAVGAAGPHELFEPAGSASAAGAAAERPTEPPPADDDGEPPEEPLDPAAARIVATLEDEVLVIDEQPRYHLPGCRSLTANLVIPLPAREAVELGFTPCAWCTPDATLAGRHPAEARH